MAETAHRIIVKPLKDETDPDGWRRLRAWLKAGLRGYRLQCVDIGPATTEERETVSQQLKGGAK